MTGVEAEWVLRELRTQLGGTNVLTGEAGGPFTLGGAPPLPAPFPGTLAGGRDGGGEPDRAGTVRLWDAPRLADRDPCRRGPGGDREGGRPRRQECRGLRPLQALLGVAWDAGRDRGADVQALPAAGGDGDG